MIKERVIPFPYSVLSPDATFKTLCQPRVCEAEGALIYQRYVINKTNNPWPD